MRYNLWIILTIFILVIGCKKTPTPSPIKKQVQQLRRDFGILGNSIVVNLEDDNETINISFENDMLFEFGKYSVKEESKDGLNILTEFLKRYPSFNVIIEGHTDSVGNPKENQILSERRALAVADILIENNVSARRISSIGYGEERPKYDNSTEEGRSLNRRAEIKLKKVSENIIETQPEAQLIEASEEIIVMDNLESDSTIIEEPIKHKKVKKTKRQKGAKV